MDDLLIYNAHIYTLSQEGEKFAAMSVLKGKISQLYSKNPPNEDHNQIARKVINAQNQTILPGLIDSHVHFIMTAAINVLSTPVSVYENNHFNPNTLEGVKDLVVRTVENTPASKPIIFNNYIIPSIREDRLPTHMEIDEWAPNRLITFIAIDGHSVSLSSLVLKKLGLNPDEHDGILNEDMEEFDMDKIVKLFTDNLTIKYLLEGLQKTINDAIAMGLVGIHCLDGFQADPTKDISLKFLKLFGNKIPLKLRLYPQIRDISKLSPFFRKMRTKRIGGCGAWDMDGAVGAKTAAFDIPYRGEPNNYGSLLLTKEDLLPLMRKAHSLGAQITSHAIGTRAIDELIAAYSQLMEEFNDTDNKYRHRIDHFEFPSKDAVEKAINKLGLLVVPQPGFNWIDANYPGMNTYQKYLEQEVVKRQTPLKTIIETGGIVCGSSDSPVQYLDPWLQIHGMVNFPIESERISVYEALRTYTYNGAYATFEEDERGTLELGKCADFIILPKDPFQISPTELLNIVVSQTYINGKKMKKTCYKPMKFFLKLIFNPSKKL
ncbi:MAG: amidohydrolase [Candidatus Lokiarchaeota archaeon]|nr:amidohydrolase [Candidatus Lokiarchaeota archaeon]